MNISAKTLMMEQQRTGLASHLKCLKHYGPNWCWRSCGGRGGHHPVRGLDMLDGEVVTQRKPRQEFLGFLKHLDTKLSAELEVHLIADNYATHKHPGVKAWLAGHPRYHMHCTPTYASRLNQVERSFGLTTHQAMRRGSFRSVKALLQRTDVYVTNHSLHRRPFVWTVSAESMLAK